ncbi:MAG: HU family DNA-binding protein [Bacteroidetes bacterium]|nr:MAG: HU family DNA-binding protein [Bacteroidota bacterium]
MALNKTQLISNVASSAKMTKVEAERAVKSTFEAIQKELAGGGNVTLIGFGTFSVYERSARTGKNPRTGATIKIAAKKVPKFKAGKALADVVAKKRSAAAPKAKPKKRK